METAESISIFTIDDDFVNQWFDAFDPSIRTFVIDFVVNKMKRYDFDLEKMEEDGDKYFANLLGNHFAAFLKSKMMDAKPGRLLTGWHLLSPLE